MTRSQLITILASRLGHLSVGDIDLATRTMLQHLSDALANGSRIEVRGFGSFALRYRGPYSGRNPKTGASITVPARHVLHFKAYRSLTAPSC